MSKLFDSRLADVIRKPVITEKATNALDLNQYTFEVDHRASMLSTMSKIVEEEIEQPGDESTEQNDTFAYRLSIFKKKSEIF